MAVSNLEQTKHKFNIALTILAAIFLSVAASINWWTQGYGEIAVHFDIWKTVVCNEGVCLLSSFNTSGWILFVRLMIVVGLFCFAGTIAAQAVYIFKPKNVFRVSAVVFASIAGGVLTLTGFVITVVFLGISKQYNTATLRLTLDPAALRYQTLPLGFIFLSAFISCIVGAFIVVNIEPKRRQKQDTPKIAETNNSKEDPEKAIMLTQM